MSDQPPQYPSYPGPEQPGPPPPPPPGYQPPPNYGQAPPAYGMGAATGPATPYASWWSRVGASLIDGLLTIAIAIVPASIGAVILGMSATTSTDAAGYTTIEDANPLAFVFFGIAFIGAFAFGVWNVVFRQGRNGQTVGKKIVGIQVVRADTGQFLGAATAFLRWLLASIVGQACFLNYLWPLWDDKNQTWHDKIVGSVVLTT